MEGRVPAMEAAPAAGGGVEAEADPIQLDPPTVRRLLAALRSKITANIQKRDLHQQDPSKFMESELELEQELQRVKMVAVAPELYAEAAKAGMAAGLLQLLSHANADVVCSALDVLREVTDPDTLAEHENTRHLVVDLVEGQAVQLLLAALLRLSEADEGEREGVQNALGVFLNLVEAVDTHDGVREALFGPEARTAWGSLLRYLTRRVLVEPKRFDLNKGNAAELLACLLQGDQRLRSELPATMVDKQGSEAGAAKDEINGVHALLQALSVYTKRREHVQDGEIDFVDNLAAALCCALTEPNGQEAFVKANGALLLTLLAQGPKRRRQPEAQQKGAERKREHALRHTLKHAALKALSFACDGCKAACESLVDSGGLGVVSAFFMLDLRGGGSEEQHALEQRAVAVLHSLCRHVDGERGQRLVAKFREGAFQKVDRSVELLLKFRRRQTQAQQRARRWGALQERGDISADQLELHAEAEAADGAAAAQAAQQLAVVMAVVAGEDGGIWGHMRDQLAFNRLDPGVVSGLVGGALEAHKAAGDEALQECAFLEAALARLRARMVGTSAAGGTSECMPPPPSRVRMREADDSGTGAVGDAAGGSPPGQRRRLDARGGGDSPPRAG
eukprot:TRINITY_DN19554_c0_g1_i2.p1 TRINITY_DN19554_c0_g1~~TRINITY_DN19554_c0_g1_i2.p1  ORF type:complete len:622 (+),score=223.47 TRINITY_DN19554_c0_g1_i2:159-2024(+)